MRKDIKVLLVSRAAWDNRNNTGNTLSNLFQGWNHESIAQIYSNPAPPNNSVCLKYFQFSDISLLRSLIKKNAKPGYAFSLIDTRVNNEDSKKDRKPFGYISLDRIYDLFRIYRFNIFFLMRELLWKITKWKTSELSSWLNEVNPDIIFAPAYDSLYMYSLSNYISRYCKKNVVRLLAEDIYSMRQLSLSPLFWIKRLILRKYIKDAVSQAKAVFVMTPIQKKEYEQLLDCQTEILSKGGKFNDVEKPEYSPNSPLRFVYAGNVFSGRWRTLELLGKSIERANNNKVRAELYIYTQNRISKRMKRAFNIPNAIKFMGAIPADKVACVLKDADIVLHVESFALKDRLETRLSFSTKIVDCLESARCVLAIGWSEAASIKYLADNDAAITITAKDALNRTILDLIENPKKIKLYSEKAWNMGKSFHKIETIQKKLRTHLLKVTSY